MFGTRRVAVGLSSTLVLLALEGCGEGHLGESKGDGEDRLQSAQKADDGTSSESDAKGSAKSQTDDETRDDDDVSAHPSDDDADENDVDDSATPGDTDESPDQLGDSATPDDDSSASTACDVTAIEPDALPLRRVTTAQFRRSLPEIFRGLELPDVSLPAPLPSDGFDNGALSQPNNALLIDSEFAATAVVAEAAAQNLAQWAPCTQRTETCLTQITTFVARLAFRRAPTSAEQSRLEGFALQGLESDGFDVALQDTLQVILLSPQTLYRVEFGDADSTLTGEELATRLAFFLWRQAPDEQLLRAAEQGELQDAAGLSQHTQRLLQDDRGRATVEDFVSQWLDVERLSQLQLNAEAYPELTNELRDSLRQSLESFVGWALWERNSLDALLRSDVVFVDDELASLLGLASGREGFELAHVEHRHGLLTQPGVLASTSHGSVHSPILRGLKVLKNFLCLSIGAPPPGAAAAIEPKPDDQAITTRQHVEQTHSAGSTCVGCHRLIDGVGFTFENYDALGRYVTEENGMAVDSSGLLPLNSGFENVANGMELSQLLETSDDVRECLSEHLYRYAFGIAAESAGAQCLVENLALSWKDSDGAPGPLIERLVSSSAFTRLPDATGSQ